jgi:deoxyuridine 5'-triphosphate nucleotidohydrolase
MLLILPRSGNALKKKLLIPNSPGLIDEDFRGHLQIILTWIPPQTETEDDGLPYICKIKKGERVAQAVLVPYVEQNWVKTDVLPNTKRSKGGFGSTGN